MNRCNVSLFQSSRKIIDFRQFWNKIKVVLLWIGYLSLAFLLNTIISRSSHPPDLSKRCSENIQRIYTKTPMWGSTPFLTNTFGWLLLHIHEFCLLMIELFSVVSWMTWWNPLGIRLGILFSRSFFSKTFLSIKTRGGSRLNCTSAKRLSQV